MLRFSTSFVYVNLQKGQITNYKKQTKKRSDIQNIKTTGKKKVNQMTHPNSRIIKPYNNNLGVRGFNQRMVNSTNRTYRIRPLG